MPCCLTRLVIATTVCLPTIVASCGAAAADPPRQLLRALIVDGQNNHGNWPQTTAMMREYLRATGLFDVDVVTHAPLGPDPSFAPAFGEHDVVVSNFGHGAAEWKPTTKAAFEDYVRGGGGFVVVHAADNAFPEWPAYNAMIGLGGWGGRTEKSGPYVYYAADGTLVRDMAPGTAGSHGPQHPFVVQVRDPDHPITKGMPPVWMHANDELYDSLRGPAENMEILATAYSARSQRHEPMMMTVRHGTGRVFHTPLGHGNDSQECVGFITTFTRGCEWAATGAVTLPIPPDFPSAEAPRSRSFQQPPTRPQEVNRDPPASAAGETRVVPSR